MKGYSGEVGGPMKLYSGADGGAITGLQYPTTKFTSCITVKEVKGVSCLTAQSSYSDLPGNWSSQKLFWCLPRAIVHVYIERLGGQEISWPFHTNRGNQSANLCSTQGRLICLGKLQ